jgi:formyl-CoA transferase
VKEQGISVSLEHPKLGKINLLNQGVKLSRTPADINRIAPELGEHTLEILSSLGYSNEEIESFKKEQVV